MKVNKIKQSYQKYLNRVESLKGIARMPYLRVEENPPDLNVQYYRKYTLKEFTQTGKLFLSEFQ